MGYATAKDFADTMDITASVELHLRTNCYPPVPYEMAPVCVAAIDSIRNGDDEYLIELPEGVLWRGQTTAPAWSVAENFHLGAWLW